MAAFVCRGAQVSCWPTLAKSSVRPNVGCQGMTGSFARATNSTLMTRSGLCCSKPFADDESLL
jgi:hypothetical protein